MPRTTPSQFTYNPFLAGTVRSDVLMSKVLADTLPRAMAATAAYPAFAGVLADLVAADAAWSAGESRVTHAAATLPAATLLFDDKMLSLTRTPDVETPSLLERWDSIIRSEVSYGGSTYVRLLPRGRQGLTKGRREMQLDALRAFGESLSKQTAKPALVALGVTVSAFAASARALRNAQTAAKSALKVARQAQEQLRVDAAAALFALVGQGMVTWSRTPERIDTLYDVNLLRPKRHAAASAPQGLDS